jgi:predicted permease
LTELLLAACLQRGHRRDGVLGDLHEELLAIAARRGAAAARRWYRRQALLVAARQIRERVIERHAPWARITHDNHPSLPAKDGLIDRGKRASPIMDLVTDVRVGLRGLRRQPGFTAVVILTLAVGIGANGAIFSVVERVLLRPLPYPEPERVVQIWGSNEARDATRLGASLHDFEDWRARSDTLEAIGVYNTGATNLSYGELPARIAFAQVSPSVFEVLGAAPTIGRTFREEENLPGNDTVVIVSHDFWRTILGADDNALDATVELDGTSMRIVGVMPEGFSFPSPQTRLWKPFGMRPDDSGDRGGRWVSAVGRLAPGETLDSAQAEMTAIAAALAAEHPDTNEGYGIFLEPRSDALVRDSRPTVLIAWAVVGLVLIIACTNVASLMLSRSTTRASEMAVRASLGAGRGRLARQLLTESLLLGSAGGVAGALVAQWLVGILRGMDTGVVGQLGDISVTWPVVAYVAALSLLTAAISGLAPALEMTRLDLSRGLRDGAGGGTGRRRVREVLVAAQLGLSVVVLIGAALLLRTFWNLSQVDLGFAVESRIEARLAPSWRELPGRPQAVELVDRVIESLEGLPGIESAGAVNSLPLVGGNSWRTSIFSIDRVEEADDQRPSIGYRTVAGEYFEALDVELLAGRYLDAGDVAGAEPVAVMSRAAATAMWPRQRALDRELWLVPEGDPAHKRYRVVGVVEDVVDNSPGTPPTPLVYFSLSQAQWGHFQDWGTSFVAHTSGDARSLVESVRQAIERASAGAPVFGVQTLDDRLRGSLASSRFNMLMIGCLGLVALALASIGVYGVMGFMVTQRTREIGTRVALGAARAQVIGLVIRRGVGLATGGVLLGLLAAYGAHGVIESLLFGVAATDAVSYAGIAVTLLGVAVLASLVPAWRAARIDPLVCLRDD